MPLSEILDKLKYLRQEVVELKEEILTVKKEVLEARTILNNDIRRNDMGKGIFRLPNELLGKVLDHVNQMDIVNFSKVQRSFRTICRAKLMKNIFVVKDNYEFGIPKTWYGGSTYTGWTVVTISQFMKMAKTTKHLNLIKTVALIHPEIVSIDFLNFLSKKSPDCGVTFGYTNEDSKKVWITTHQRDRCSTTIVLHDGHNYKLTEKQMIRAKKLDIYAFTTAKIKKQLTAVHNFSNLKVLELNEPPAFWLSRKICVSTLSLYVKNGTLVRDILKNFDLGVIKKLHIENNQDLLFEALDSNCGNFDSLELLYIPISIDQSIRIMRHLPRDSLKIVNVPIINEQMDKLLIIDALKHHQNSLATITESCHGKSLVKKGSFSTFIDPIEFPKLQEVISKHRVMKVNRFGDLAELVPVQFH